jgi:hypothetical protein
MTVTEDVRVEAGWRGGEIAAGSGWRIELSTAQRAELLAALRYRDFPLPTLGPVFRQLADDVITGRGFALVRGLPVEGLSERECDTMALGIGRHVGTVVPQGPDTVVVRHVRDQGVHPAGPTSRSYQHSGRLGFHSDPTDVVALLCVRPARSGGLSTIVSSVAVHNEIVRTRPDLAAELYRPWWRDGRTGHTFHLKPVYTMDDAGRVTADYGPDHIHSAQRVPQVPRLTGGQREAMELLNALNDDPRFALTMDLRAGDMQFLNNHVTMHSRTAYVDHPEPERRRDLIRLWLDAR